MKLKDAYFVVGIGGLTFFFCFLVFRKQHTDPIRYENYEKIQIGMSRAEVKELLGCGPCMHLNGVTITSMCTGKRCEHSVGEADVDVFGIWEGEWKKISINFVDDRVERKSLENKAIQPSDWIVRFTGCLGFGENVETTFTTVGE